jgi:hypothetical protein
VVPAAASHHASLCTALRALVVRLFDFQVHSQTSRHGHVALLRSTEVCGTRQRKLKLYVTQNNIRTTGVRLKAPLDSLEVI